MSDQLPEHRTEPASEAGARGGDGLFHALTLRQALSVIALAAVIIWGVVAWQGRDTGAGPDQEAACFVTGSGQELCGAAAVAYCDIHEEQYRSDEDHGSLDACEGARDSVGADTAFP